MNPARLRLALSLLVGIAMGVIGGAAGAGIIGWLAGLPVIGMVTAGLACFALAATFTWRRL